MENFLLSLSSVIWGIPSIALFLFTGIRFTVKSRFFQFRHIGFIFKETLGSLFKKEKKTGVSIFSAFCSVLGACVGTGNIVGVATAVYSGGAGVLFWMWVSAFFSMMTAYIENYLGQQYKHKDKYGVFSGGAFSYIEKGVGSKALAKIYGVFCLFSSLTMGNMIQSNSVTEALGNNFDLNKTTLGILLAVVCFFIIKGGVKRITHIQTVLVPVMTLLYLGVSFYILYEFKGNILPSVALIIKSAFTPKAINGFGIFKAMQYGFSRGVFSNEAGLGSSTIIHAEVDSTGELQGMWAMVEVFFDTVILCTVTGLVILVTDAFKLNLYGTALSVKAYSVIGDVGGDIISVVTALFAFTSICSCAFYGEKSFSYLFGKKFLFVYRIIYGVLIFIGTVNPPQILWTLADIFNGVMGVINLFSINWLGKSANSVLS
ncbi:MAG: alanine/glycine:cation symporter family protein [Acutalibacteraceae bacterium]